MFKMGMYLIITIGILHFILYYFNFDFNFENFNYFKPVNETNARSDSGSELESTKGKFINFEISDQTLIDSINELKTLNECINNGEINAFFS